MEHLTHEEILEQLRRIANGDAYNDLEDLESSLPHLITEVEFLIREKSAKIKD